MMTHPFKNKITPVCPIKNNKYVFLQITFEVCKILLAAYKLLTHLIKMSKQVRHNCLLTKSQNNNKLANIFKTNLYFEFTG